MANFFTVTSSNYIPPPCYFIRSVSLKVKKSLLRNNLYPESSYEAQTLDTSISLPSLLYISFASMLRQLWTYSLHGQMTVQVHFLKGMFQHEWLSTLNHADVLFCSSEVIIRLVRLGRKWIKNYATRKYTAGCETTLTKSGSDPSLSESGFKIDVHWYSKSECHIWTKQSKLPEKGGQIISAWQRLEDVAFYLNRFQPNEACLLCYLNSNVVKCTKPSLHPFQLLQIVWIHGNPIAYNYEFSEAIKIVYLQYVYICIQCRQLYFFLYVLCDGILKKFF